MPSTLSWPGDAVHPIEHRPIMMTRDPVNAAHARTRLSDQEHTLSPQHALQPNVGSQPTLQFVFRYCILA